jgi:flagellar FliJ protein
MNRCASFTQLERFATEQNFRKLSRIELTIQEFSLVVAELDDVITAEEARVGIFDPWHFAYPCYAKAVAQRRDNLRRSIEGLKLQLERDRADDQNAPFNLINIDAPDHYFHRTALPQRR